MAINDAAIDLAAIGRLAKALTFISGADHPGDTCDEAGHRNRSPTPT